MLLILAFLFSFSSFGKPSLENFTPGPYQLISGKIEACDEGDFTFIEDDTVAFGAFQLFALKPSKRVLGGWTTDDKHCKYYGSDTVSVSGAKTILGFESKKVCPDGHRYTLTKTAVVSSAKIIVDVQQKRGANAVDEEEFSERCEWVPKKKSPEKPPSR